MASPQTRLPFCGFCGKTTIVEDNYSGRQPSSFKRNMFGVDPNLIRIAHSHRDLGLSNPIKISNQHQDDSVKKSYKRIVSGKIVHAHIVPTFSRKVDKDTGLDVNNKNDTAANKSSNHHLEKENDTDSVNDVYITGKKIILKKQRLSLL